ncbi:MAG: class IV adenylate cyclase [Thermoguttaceae bacterium]|nr:class IV adenylate cyclase [Thermoguttaceae bacterium]
MKYEVEQKFPVEGFGAVRTRLEALHARFSAGHEETDVYFNHPQRDFRETDEALRIRRRGQSNRVTYKGPKIDSTTKTRRELELDLPEGEETAAGWVELLETLGFRQVGRVHKRRRKFRVDWQDRTIEGTLDEIDGLGEFVELELVVEEGEIDDARKAIGGLAAELGLSTSERRSYLQLLLSQP